MADCIKKILEIYDNSETTKYFILIKLMRDLKENSSNILKIRDCLLLLINLCFDLRCSDDFNNKGKSVHQLSEKEKSQMCKLLQIEINN
ncbi:MAG: hypothetical protein ACFFD5_14500 [Candidatus Thorarchaeota archaeon]